MGARAELEGAKVELARLPSVCLDFFLCAAAWGGACTERDPGGCQKAEEGGKQYRKWLAALAEYSRALLSAKEAAEAAQAEAKGREEDLALFLAEADSFLLTREGKHRSRRRKDKDACAPRSGLRDL